MQFKSVHKIFNSITYDFLPEELQKLYFVHQMKVRSEVARMEIVGDGVICQSIFIANTAKTSTAVLNLGQP